MPFQWTPSHTRTIWPISGYFIEVLFFLDNLHESNCTTVKKNKKHEEKYSSLKSGYAGIREIHQGKERFMKCVGHYKPQN